MDRRWEISGEEFISHRFNISEVSNALETVKERKVIKSILNYG